MYAVIFEVEINKTKQEEYLAIASETGQLKIL
jgi:hypothetical protein